LTDPAVTNRPAPGVWSSEFTVSSIALYHLHDIVHHAWDVDPLR
jgi:hypothetical protein